MQFGPDVEIICPQCDKKAHFTFPFRMLNAPFIADAQAVHPEAEYREIAPDTRLEGPRIVREFVNGNFYFNQEESTWLINLFPKLFSFEKTGRFDGVVKCPHCALLRADVLTHEKYWYKIPVNGRYLLARSAKELIHQKKWFSGETPRNWQNRPLNDYPGEFYRESEKIVGLITELLEREN